MKFSSNNSWSRSNQCLDLEDFPWKLYLLVFSFPFLFSDSFRRIMTTFSYKPFPIAIISKLPWLHMLGTEVHLDYFYIGLKILEEKVLLLQKQLSITSYIGLQFCFVFGNINCFLIFQIIMLLFYWNNHVIVVFIDFICFLIYINIRIILFRFLFFVFL